jgi:hypothetical protein
VSVNRYNLRISNRAERISCYRGIRAASHRGHES